MEWIGDISPFLGKEPSALEKLIIQNGINSCPCFQPQQNCQELIGHRLMHLLSPEHSPYRLGFKNVSMSLWIVVELSCSFTEDFRAINELPYTSP